MLLLSRWAHNAEIQWILGGGVEVEVEGGGDMSREAVARVEHEIETRSN